MGMNAGLPYRSTNRVVRFEQDRAIAWETVGEVRGHRVVGGQVWAYEILHDPLALHDPGRCLVRHTYDWGAATGAPLLQRIGFPRRARPSMVATLDRLAGLLAHTAA